MSGGERQLVATTTAAGLSRLGTAGQRSFELVSQWVARHLDADHAALFAEPVTSDSGDQVDWYTPLAGCVQPMQALPPDVQASLQHRLADRMDAIRSRVAALEGSADANTQRLAEALSNALTIPGPDAVHAVQTGGDSTDLQPVLVDWASVRADHGGIGDKLLTGWTPRRPPPPPSPVPAVPQGHPAAAYPVAGVVAPAHPGRSAWPLWLAWLIPALLAALVFYLLIAPCGLRGSAFLNFCPRAAVSSQPLDDLVRDRGVLENRVASLESEIAQSRQSCTPQAAPEPLPPPEDQAQPAPDDFQERLQRENAGTGEVDIALIWNSRADLDLHVRCPAGDEIYYRNSTSAACGGTLDVDMNAGGDRRNEPVEHVFFQTPAAGTYRITVVFFDARSFGGSHPFTLRISFGGDVQEFSGVLDRANPTWSTNYEYAP